MAAAEAHGSALQANFGELQTECWAVNIEVAAGLIVVVRMAKRKRTIAEQVNKSDTELQETHHELKIASRADVEAHYLA